MPSLPHSVCRLLLVLWMTAVHAHAQNLPAQTAPAPATPANDCRQARDPERCTARQRATRECESLRQKGSALRECLEDRMPPLDCSKARNPKRCEAMLKAQAACRNKPFTERHQCIRHHLPKPQDCNHKKRPAQCKTKRDPAGPATGRHARGKAPAPKSAAGPTQPLLSALTGNRSK